MERIQDQATITGNIHTTDGLNWSESNMPSDSQGVSYDWDTDYTQILYGNGVFILGGKAEVNGPS